MATEVGMPASHDLFDKLTIERVVNQAAFRLMIAIADQEARRIIARVQGHSMRRVELFERVSLGAEMHQVFSVFVELEDVVARVTVRQIDVAIGGNGDGGGAELRQFQSRLLRKGQVQTS
jgi:hypothetical protein